MPISMLCLYLVFLLHLLLVVFRFVFGIFSDDEFGESAKGKIASLEMRNSKFYCAVRKMYGGTLLYEALQGPRVHTSNSSAMHIFV